jgi:hypothetical protein
MAFDLTVLGGTPGYSTTAKFGTQSKASVYDVGTTATPTFAASSTGTIEWFYNTSNASANTVMLLLNGATASWIGIFAGNLTAVWMNGSTVTLSATNTADGAWHHVVITFNGTLASVYQDGTRVGTFDAASLGATWASLSGTTIGFGGLLPLNSGFNFPGLMDEISISTTVQYSGATLTVPTAAFSNSRAGQIAVFHFENPTPLVNSNGVSAATAYTLTGPTSGTTGAASTNFTVTLNGTISSSMVVTPSDSSGGGTFTPTSLTFTSGGGATGTFTYTPGSVGAKTISSTNTGSLTNPASLTYTSTAITATTYTLTGPSGGLPSVASANFTITLNGNASVSTIITPSDSAAGGTFAPTTLTFTNGGSQTGTFAYTPNATLGVKTISTTNSASLTNPSSQSYTVANASVTIAPNNAAIYYSPYNWSVSSGSAISWNPGAYFRTLFSGTSCVLNFNTSTNGTPLSQIWWRIDNGPWTSANVASTITCTIPPLLSGNTDTPYHVLEVGFKSMESAGALSRWASTAQTAIHFTGLTLAVGAAVHAPGNAARNILIYGDSITEGIRTLGEAQTNTPDDNDAFYGWVMALRELLGAEIGVVGFGGTGYTSSFADCPTFVSSYNLMSSGVARVFSPVPSLIINNQGTNDGNNDVTAAATTVLNGLLAACPGTAIMILNPFPRGTNTFLQAAAVACSNPSLVTFTSTSGWLVSTYGVDSLGLHPSGANGKAILAPLVAAAAIPLLGGVTPTAHRWTH